MSTPISERKCVSIFGDTNAGKSALFNAIIEQDYVIVSDKSGTTTDPVIKAMELIPYGPITLVDTAGFMDFSDLGGERLKKTKQIFDRTDVCIFAADINHFNEQSYTNLKTEMAKRNIPVILVFTKTDIDKSNQSEYLNKYKNALFVSVNDRSSIDNLKKVLSDTLTSLGKENTSMIYDLVKSFSNVVLVCPIDSAAPAGRLILPQVSLIRDCLDNDIKCHVVTEKLLKSVLNDIKDIALVVTDSQAFEYVNSVVPKNIPLTSFSLLQARLKGDLDEFFQGANAIESLKDNAKILIAEGCSHNKTHEDIGTVKIPKKLKEKTKKELQFDFVSGFYFPEDVSQYDLIIHCGACMLNKKTMQTRIEKAKELNIPITNYGVVLAYLTGILDRCRDLFI